MYFTHIMLKEGIRGVGFIIGDSNGNLEGAVAMRAPVMVSILATELYALKAGLLFANDASFIPLIVESDCLNAVNMINSGDVCFATEGGSSGGNPKAAAP